MLALFPEGFEEAERGAEYELSAYTDAAGEARMEDAFGPLVATAVPSDWEHRWKRFHRPIRAGSLWIVPPWEDERRYGEAITIDPGRAFGTGAHPTTRLCLELISELEPGSLLDVGCGSGVLAIAAARLGFDPVTGLDKDAMAIEAAERNAAANGVDPEFRLADALVETLPAADVAVVNISEGVVVEVATGLDCTCLITSGYFEAFTPKLGGFRALGRRTLEGWAADLHGRQYHPAP
jgi:ribosomal protein L11 methyltransferase